MDTQYPWLMIGDCLERLKEIPDQSVDLVVTSPPYDNLRDYNGYSFEFEKIAIELARVIKDGGVIVWVVCDATIKGSETGTSFRQALYFKDVCGLNLHDTMIYYKLNAMPIKAPRYQSVFEYMFVFSRGKPAAVNLLKEPCVKAGQSRSNPKVWRTIAGKDLKVTADSAGGIYNAEKPRHNVWGYLVGNTTDEARWKHPAKFPLQLPLDHIYSWSNKGDIVLDPFMGSGTTGVAALELERRFIGIEISEEYFKMSQERLQTIIDEKSQQLFSDVS